MSATSPKVSIGLPVYNGEKYLEQAIDAILSQTFTDFELIISDNASTDRTGEICRHYAAQDSRVRYIYNPQNKGATWNFNRVWELARGKYFKWQAHDDLIAPEFIEVCVNALEKDPSAVLAFTDMYFIDDQGCFLENYDVQLQTNSSKGWLRFKELVLEWHQCFDIFGLIRSDALRRTPGMGSFGHADGLLLERLALQGRFYLDPRTLFFSRRHNNQSMLVYGVKNTNYYLYTLWFDPSKTGKILFPFWRMFWERLLAIFQPRIGLSDRLLSLYPLFRWVFRKKKILFQELVIGLFQYIDRIFKIPGLRKVAQRIALKNE